ncbi:arylsulfatase [Dyadobacter fermentans]|uniref:Sulfatase n=1 Tax=Dyadobacter fermentans (strain ATCC 700827 / DSM 18053 / CIP 107007 / KCTC 52180 / NS114) TaxID=471854 RepID=C6VSQ8_DYAFD|nr:arylsulfatase [Dyadobacter fermentans]ACT92880.1 sulfatase [Dyadobacter fermentans DSM 18053]
MLKRLSTWALALLIGARAMGQSPNIVFILADDLGYGDIGAHGQKLLRTPNIDALAKEGMIFTDIHAGAPVCSPSRSVLITGLHTGHTTIRGNATIRGGIVGNKGKQTVRRANLAAGDFTVGKLMAQSGYTTALTGKWHLDGYDTLATPIHRGFDQFSGWLIAYPGTYANGYWPAKRYVNGVLKDVEQNENGRKGYYADDLTTDESLAFLAAQKDAKKPFVLMINYNSPHSPLDAADSSAYKDRDWPQDMKIYGAQVHHLDENVGKIKKYLTESGLAKNTIVFFCSDNGPRSEGTPQQTAIAEFFDSNGRLRGYKRDMYEGGIRVPMVVWAPGIVKPGSVSSEPAYFADIMPTFADIAGSKVSYTTDGASVLASIKGKAAWQPRFLYWEFFEKGFEQAVRYGKWKAVKAKGKLELYDLDKDISETNDVSADNPAIVAKIENYLKTSRTESPFWPVEGK